MHELNDLAGARAGPGAGRVRADAVSAGLAQNDCGDVAAAGRDAAAIWWWNSGCGLRDLLHVERPHGSLKSSPKFMQSYAKSAENRKLRW